jgi:hypothetical protein
MPSTHFLKIHFNIIFPSESLQIYILILVSYIEACIPRLTIPYTLYDFLLFYAVIIYFQYEKGDRSLQHVTVVGSNSLFCCVLNFKIILVIWTLLVMNMTTKLPCHSPLLREMWLNKKNIFAMKKNDCFIIRIYIIKKLTVFLCTLS